MRTLSTSPITLKLVAVSDLIRLPRQHGTLLLLWPTLWSLFMASNGAPSPKLLVVFVVGTFLMRSAGCAINDIADRNFDPFVERTRERPLANKRLSVAEALFVFIALSALAFALVLQLNGLTIILSIVGVALAGVYPFVKRVSHWPQAFLGMAFGWGAVMAWSAVENSLGSVPFLIFGANVCWSLAYDTIYALMDKDDDLKVGVKSTAIILGGRVYTALVCFYLGFCALLALAGALAGLGVMYFVGVVVALAVSLRTVASIRKDTSRSSRMNGFKINAIVGGVVLLFLIVDIFYS